MLFASNINCLCEICHPVWKLNSHLSNFKWIRMVSWSTAFAFCSGDLQPSVNYFCLIQLESWLLTTNSCRTCSQKDFKLFYFSYNVSNPFQKYRFITKWAETMNALLVKEQTALSSLTRFCSYFTYTLVAYITILLKNLIIYQHILVRRTRYSLFQNILRTEMW